MTRKEWLETFLNLADGNASSMAYRKKLGIRAQKLPTFVRQIGKFRKELEKLCVEDVYAANRKKKEESLKRARQVIREKRERERLERLQAEAEQEDVSNANGSIEAGETGGTPEEPDAAGDSEAMGTRDDSGDEPDVHG